MPAFRRHYGLDLRVARTTMAWQELALHLIDMPSDEAVPEWSMQDENAARLLDVMTYWLNVEYVKWTTDPDEAREAAKHGERVPQPPFPIVEPVAYRPPAAHAAAVARYEALIEQWHADNRPDPEQPSARDMFARISKSSSTPIRTFPKGGE